MCFILLTFIYLYISEKHEFASNIISIKENKNKLDNAKKEKSNDDI